jgi:hypothetical protein
MMIWGIKLDNYLLTQLNGEWSSLGWDEDWSNVYRVTYLPTLANPVEDVISTFQTHHPPYQVLIDTLIWQDRLYWTTARLYWAQFKKTTVSEVVPNLHQLLGLQLLCRKITSIVDSVALEWLTQYSKRAHNITPVDVHNRPIHGLQPTLVTRVVHQMKMVMEWATVNRHLDTAVTS